MTTARDTGAAAPEAKAGWALFLDFDGTLTEIARHPEEVIVAADLASLMTRIKEHCAGALALVSGRAIADLDRFFAPAQFDAAGLHGMEMRIAGQKHGASTANDDALRRVVPALAARFSSESGLLLENKGVAIAAHWRQAPEKAELALGLMEQALRELGSGFRLQSGKSVCEIVATAADKGQAIETFMRQPPYLGRRPLFIGDDLTDEHGFRSVNEAGGVSVKVGSGETIAGYRLAGPSDVLSSLRGWASGAAIRPEQDFCS
jgi:trehalose 6-phosphate phosphatase